jgi:hypothetical protein
MVDRKENYARISDTMDEVSKKLVSIIPYQEV